jgi:hypothetical protein
VDVPVPALAGFEIVLEVRIALGGAAHCRDRVVGERRTAEVRVDDHPGRVHDRPERAAGGVREPGHERLLDRLRGRTDPTPEHRLPDPFEIRADGLHHRSPPEPGEQPGPIRRLEEPVRLRQLAKLAERRRVA